MEWLLLDRIRYRVLYFIVTIATQSLVVLRKSAIDVKFTIGGFDVLRTSLSIFLALVKKHFTQELGDKV